MTHLVCLQGYGGYCGYHGYSAKKFQLGPKHIIIRVIGYVRPPGATWYTGY